jgi:hypothetical protein
MTRLMFQTVQQFDTLYLQLKEIVIFSCPQGVVEERVQCVVYLVVMLLGEIGTTARTGWIPVVGT